MDPNLPRDIPWAALFSDDGMIAELLEEVLAEQWADDIERDRDEPEPPDSAGALPPPGDKSPG
jgi:hypothetical protein